MWAIAFSPLWLFVALQLAGWFVRLPGLAALPLVVAAAGLVVLLGAAEWDRRLLIARGAVRTASVLWMLLTPLGYLVARRHALRGMEGRRSIPLAVLVVLLVGILAVVGFLAVAITGGLGLLIPIGAGLLG